MENLLVNKRIYEDLTKEYKTSGYYSELIFLDRQEYADFLELGGNIFVFLGRSGAGKTTLANILTRKKGLSFLPRITTRPKRKDEQETEYLFKDISLLEEKELFSLKKYSGNYYALDRNTLIASLQSDEGKILIAGTYEGFLLKDIFPRISLVYIDSDENMARFSVKGRNDAVQYEMRHYLQGLDELSRNFSDYIVFNERDKLDQTLRVLESIVYSKKS